MRAMRAAAACRWPLGRRVRSILLANPRNVSHRRRPMRFLSANNSSDTNATKYSDIKDRFDEEEQRLHREMFPDDAVSGGVPVRWEDFDPDWKLITTEKAKIHFLLDDEDLLELQPVVKSDPYHSVSGRRDSDEAQRTIEMYWEPHVVAVARKHLCVIRTNPSASARLQIYRQSSR
ncbi:MAG: hypothetical protein MHM6MM_007648 [Cercozoa sp. M6MM]